MPARTVLVEEAFTGRCAAKTGNTVQATDLALEFVVIRQFFVYRQVLGTTIRLASGPGEENLLMAMSRRA